jgi:hypothetical protein
MPLSKSNNAPWQADTHRHHKPSAKAMCNLSRLNAPGIFALNKLTITLSDFASQIEKRSAYLDLNVSRIPSSSFDRKPRVSIESSIVIHYKRSYCQTATLCRFSLVTSTCGRTRPTRCLKERYLSPIDIPESAPALPLGIVQSPERIHNQATYRKCVPPVAHPDSRTLRLQFEPELIRCFKWHIVEELCSFVSLYFVKFLELCSDLGMDLLRVAF